MNLLESSTDTNGAYTLLEITLEPGEGNALHYHSDYETEYHVVDGSLQIDLEKRHVSVSDNKTLALRKGKLHRYINTGYTPVTFQMKFIPAHEGFEKSLQMQKNIDPTLTKKNVTQLSVLHHLTNTRLPEVFQAFQQFMNWEARRVLGKGEFA